MPATDVAARPPLRRPDPRRRCARRTSRGSSSPGERAYKVKKPLVLPFLDYGTPARRRAMCRAEVGAQPPARPRRLPRRPVARARRRRAAPARRRRTTPRAVDYAVEMRRYAEADTLAARLAAGTAGPAELAAVGERLAAFHAAAEPRRPPGRRRGGQARARRQLRDAAELLATGGASGRASRCRAVRRRIPRPRAWDELTDAGRRRPRARRPRRPAAGARAARRATSRSSTASSSMPGLRQIDVAADLAFLVMELHEAGRADLARRRSSRSYRAAGGDAGSDALIAFFAAYRAEVRAKVALHARRTARRRATRPRDERATRRRCWRSATRLRWAARTPLVVVVAGLSGIGQDDRRRGARLPRPGFTPHQLRRRAQARWPGSRRPSRAPERSTPAESNRATYAELGRLAAARAASGVIVDATFRRRADRDAFRAAARRAARTCCSPSAGRPPPCWTPRARARAARQAACRTPGPTSSAASCWTPSRSTRSMLATTCSLRSDRPVAAILAEIADALDRRALGSVVLPARIRNTPCCCGGGAWGEAERMTPIQPRTSASLLADQAGLRSHRAGELSSQRHRA